MARQVYRARFRRQSARDGEPAHVEDGGFRLAEDLGLPIADCRLPICEVPPTGAAHQHPNGGPKGLLPEKDGENEGTSGDVYENKGMETKCLVTNSASRTKMHQSHTC